MKIAIIALAGAIAIATPAHACTDWKAVAAMDAALLSHGGKVLEFRGGAMSGQWETALNSIVNDAFETRLHIIRALNDTCKEWRLWGNP